ncbi:hypothetical protein KI688_005377 [Linnemannia hyalina]|uniref:Uncharacterized protein n=1 Tax=Linnemannia hyalina TaxID=64524 RepID=A0A9P7XKC1_9FUNG|nr:hypothetical protein KI688_005377 [Linnemannia hyalina]
MIQGIQDNFFSGRHDILDYADQIYQGLDNIDNLETHSTQSISQSNTSSAKYTSLPVYTGVDGDDAVLTPWDMVHAVHLAVHLGFGIYAELFAYAWL